MVPCATSFNMKDVADSQQHPQFNSIFKVQYSVGPGRPLAAEAYTINPLATASLSRHG